MTHDEALEYWDCRETAKNYVTGASLLSGFAFAGIILILDSSTLDSQNLVLKNQSSLAFLLGFFGCVLATFNYSIIAGEGKVTCKLYNTMTASGASFTLAGSFLFWGLIPLFKLYADPQLAEFSFWIYAITVLLVLLMTSFIALDSFLLFNKNRFIIKDQKSIYFQFIGIPLLPILVTLILRFCFSSIHYYVSPLFLPILILGLLLLLVGSVLSSVIQHQKNDFHLSKTSNMCIMLTYSFYYCFMILLVA